MKYFLPFAILFFLINFAIHSASGASIILNPSAGSSNGTGIIASQFSLTSDSASIRSGASFNYVGILIYETKTEYFDVAKFKSRVMSSLPEVIKLLPTTRKQYEDNFMILEYCTWVGASCGSMVQHDWQTFVGRVSLESGVSICLNTMERSRRGRFAIHPFINTTSGAKLPNGQQTLVRFSFNGANSQDILTQLDAKSMGACQLSYPEVELGAPGVFAYTGGVLASHFDSNVVPMSIALPNEIEREIHRVINAFKKDPVDSTALVILFVLFLVAIIVFVANKFWENRQRRIAFRQKQQTQQMPEEQQRRMEMKANMANGENPYFTDAKQEQEFTEHVEMKNRNGGESAAAPMDEDEIALEAAIAAARSTFKNAADQVSTFLGLPRDGDQAVASHDQDLEGENSDNKTKHYNNNDNDDDDDDDDKDHVALDLKSPPSKRQDTDSFFS